MEIPHKSFENDKSFQALYDQSLQQVIVNSNKSINILAGVIYFLEHIILGSIYLSFNITNNLIIMISTHQFILILGGAIFFIYRRKMKLSIFIQKYSDFIIICFFYGIFVLKLEIFFQIETTKNVYFVLGSTLLPTIILAEGFIARLKVRLILLILVILYMLIRMLTLDEVTVFIILQIINIGLCTFYTIRVKETSIKNLCLQMKLLCENQEDPCQDLLRVLPNTVFLLGADFETLFTNSSQINRSVTENFRNTEKIENPSEDGMSQKIDTKTDSLKLIRDLEFESNEDSLHKFFATLGSNSSGLLEDSIPEIIKSSFVRNISLYIKIFRSHPNPQQDLF